MEKILRKERKVEDKPTSEQCLKMAYENEICPVEVCSAPTVKEVVVCSAPTVMEVVVCTDPRVEK